MAYQKNEEDENRLIRLHPSTGGKLVDLTQLGIPDHLGKQKFKGVSPDVFIYLDRGNYVPYIITRKLNITIQIDPNGWPVEEFLKYLTEGRLVRTDKCMYHGDEDTGVTAHKNLEQLLKPKGLNVRVKESRWGFIIPAAQALYAFYSVGIAANSKYGAVSTRQGNDSENSSSHFEIKFKRDGSKPGDMPQHEYLCLNIHLLASPRNSFGREEVLNRLDAAIRLFYHELQLLQFPNLKKFTTVLRHTFSVTLDHHEDAAKGYKFSCKHPKSIDNMEKYKQARPYISIGKSAPAPLALVRKPPSEFKQNPDDFPAL
jgi:hypothetical protein